jgi:hypothetical protein
MRSLLVAVALGVLLGVPAASAAPASMASAANARACVPWPATLLGSRSGVATLAPTVDCRAEGVPAGTTAGPPPRVGTGIAGTVRRGPIRPVCVAGLACDGPAAGVLVEIDSGRSAVARLRTGKDGRFLVHAPPGTYVVRVVATRSAPVVVRVRSGVLSRVSLSIDTGIR